jgi:hypothetical protein
MPEKLSFELDVIDSSQKGFSSFQRNYEKLAKDQQKSFGQVATGSAGGMGFQSQKIVQSTKKYQDNQLKLLQSIDKSLKSGMGGRTPVSGGGGGINVPTRGGRLPIPSGGKGGGITSFLGGRGGGMPMGGAGGGGGAVGALGKAGAIGIIAASVISAGVGAYKLSRKATEGYREELGKQYGTMQRTSTFRGKGPRGLFRPAMDTYTSGAERGAFYAEIERLGGTSNIGRRHFEGETPEEFRAKYGRDPLKRYATDTTISRHKGRLRAVGIEEQARVLSTAYGIPMQELATMTGTAAKITTGNVPTSLFKTAALAERAGMGGVRTGEFFRQLQDTVESGISSGLSLTSLEVARTQSRFQSVDNERLKSLAPGIIKQGGQIFGAGAALKGGAGSAFALQALMTEKGMSFEAAREELAKGPKASTFEAVFSLSKKYYGDTPIRMHALQNMGFLEGIKSPKEAKRVMTSFLQSGKMDDLKIKETEGKARERAEQMVGVVKGTAVGEERRKEQRAVSEAASTLTDGLIKAGEAGTKFADKFNEISGSLIEKLKGTGNNERDEP